MKLARLLKKKKRSLRARCRSLVWVVALALFSLGVLAFIYRQGSVSLAAPRCVVVSIVLRNFP